MLAGYGCVNRQSRMRMIWHSHHHRINLTRRQDLAIIVIRFYAHAGFASVRIKTFRHLLARRQAA